MDVQKEQEIQLHKSLVEQYEIRYGGDYAKVYHNFWNSRMLKDLPVDGNLLVLDCGCGNGILLSSLVENYKHVVGMDLSAELVKTINLKNENFKGLVIADAERLPFVSESFDIVFCRGTLHHLPSPQEAIAQIYSRLKTGGYLVLSEPCDDSFILRLPRKIFREKSDRFTPGHQAFASKKIKQWLNLRRFSIEESRYFGLFAFGLCGLSDFLPIMRFLIFRRAITKILIFFDEVFCRVPLIRRQSWHILIKAKK